MAAGRRSAIAQEIAGAHLFEIFDRFAQAIRNDGALLGITFALDIPELKGIKEIAKGHAVEIVRIEPFLNIAQLHRADKDLEGVAATITATRTIRIGFRDDHALIP